jgi:hypothetical protein
VPWWRPDARRCRARPSADQGGQAVGQGLAADRRHLRDRPLGRVPGARVREPGADLGRGAEPLPVPGRGRRVAPPGPGERAGYGLGAGAGTAGATGHSRRSGRGRGGGKPVRRRRKARGKEATEPLRKARKRREGWNGSVYRRPRRGLSWGPKPTTGRSSRTRSTTSGGGEAVRVALDQPRALGVARRERLVVRPDVLERDGRLLPPHVVLAVHRWSSWCCRS